MQQKLTVHLVTWNGAKYIPFLFDSLRKQTFTDFTLEILDNDSTDSTVSAIEKELSDLPFAYRFTQLDENTGFAGGHNQLYQETDSEYFLLLNQDMFLSPDCLKDMVEYLDEHENVAAVSPRLMRWDFEQPQDPFTDEIDALGLKAFRSRRVVEWMTKQKWSDVEKSIKANKMSCHSEQSEESQGITINGGETLRSFANAQDNNVLNVFGVSGAFPMYRRAAIETVQFEDNTFLDHTYHSYKEDVDLAYRLCGAGFKARVLLDTVAYHDRSGAGPKDMIDSAAAANKRVQSSWIKYHSYKNHIATLIKNEYISNVLRDLPWIVWYELKKFVWFAIFDRSVLKGLTLLPLRSSLRRRKQMKRTRVLTARQMRNKLGL